DRDAEGADRLHPGPVQGGNQDVLLVLREPRLHGPEPKSVPSQLEELRRSGGRGGCAFSGRGSGPKARNEGGSHGGSDEFPAIHGPSFQVIGRAAAAYRIGATQSRFVHGPSPSTREPDLASRLQRDGRDLWNPVEARSVQTDRRRVAGGGRPLDWLTRDL